MTLTWDLLVLCDRTMTSLPSCVYLYMNVNKVFHGQADAGHMFALLPRPPTRRDMTSRSSNLINAPFMINTFIHVHPNPFHCSGATIAEYCAKPETSTACLQQMKMHDCFARQGRQNPVAKRDRRLVRSLRLCLRCRGVEIRRRLWLHGSQPVSDEVHLEVLGGTKCMMHVQGSRTVAILPPIFSSRALVSTFYGLVEFLGMGRVASQPQAPVEVSTFLVMNSIYVWTTCQPSSRRRAFSIISRVHSLARFARCSWSACYVCVASINSLHRIPALSYAGWGALAPIVRR
jgi:hypothetical protein